MQTPNSAPLSAPAGSVELSRTRPFVLVLTGAAAEAIMGALDICGRHAGADKGAPLWALRKEVEVQLVNDAQTENHALGIINGREAQRAAAKTEAIKKDATAAAAAKTASKRGKK